MEFEEKDEQTLDLFVLLADFFRELRRLWVLGVALILALATVLGGLRYVRYSPVYEASATFTVRVADPLYADVNIYNTKTAEQMAKTFPSILTSGVLQERVKAYMDIPYLPSVSVSATEGSNVLGISVRHSDPQLAYDALQAVIA